MSEQYFKLKDTANAKIKQLSDELNTSINPDTFCILPFTHISTMTHGEIKLCCRGQPPQSQKNPLVQNNFDLQEYWSSDYMNDVRDSLMTGERIPQCKNCWKMEDNNIQSLRQMSNLDNVDKPSYRSNVSSWVEQGKVPFRIPLIELKLSNLCNFKCRMCWPKDSSLLWTDWDKIKSFYDGSTADYLKYIHNLNNGKRIMDFYTSNTGFMDDLMTLMKHVEELEFAGGEPLLDPAHWDILDCIENPEQVSLKYSTNLSRLELGGKSVVDQWSKFKSVMVTISIDGDRANNTRIRRGSDWDILKNNVNTIKQIPTVNKIKGTTCISAFNAEHLDKTAEAVIMELGIQWHTSRLQYPEFQHANILPVEILKDSQQRLTKFKETLESAQGQRWNKLHIDNAVNWLQNCIDNNEYTPQAYEKFLEFNRVLDD